MTIERIWKKNGTFHSKSVTKTQEQLQFTFITKHKSDFQI